MAYVATKKQPIDVNAASIVELKAELFRKQEEFKRQKLLPKSEQPVKTKKPSVFEKRNRGIDKRVAKDVPDKRTAEEVAEEEAALRKSKAKLEEKTALYEQMLQGKCTKGFTNREDGYLVDFEQKQMNKVESDRKRSQGSRFEDSDDDNDEANNEPIPEPETPDDEWVEYTDSLGRSRQCLRKDLPHMQEMDKSVRSHQDSSLPPLSERTLLSDDMKREMLRQKWEKEEEEMMQRQGPTHYENVRFDEVRSHGVGYFQFSKDEGQRQEQLKMLNQMRDQTVGQRERRDKVIAKRKAALEARLEKVKLKKMKKATDNVDDVTDQAKPKDSKMTEQPSVLDIEQSTADAHTAASAVDEDKVGQASAERDAAKLEQDVFAMISSIRKEVDDAQAKDVKPVGRHWDVFRKQGDERPSEFAPPTLYNKSTRRSQGKQPLWQPGPNPVGAQLFGRNNERTDSTAGFETNPMTESRSMSDTQSSYSGFPLWPFMPFPPPPLGCPVPFPPPRFPFPPYPSATFNNSTGQEQDGPTT